MKELNLVISPNTNLDKILEENKVYRISVSWGEDVEDRKKMDLLYRINGAFRKHNNLKILDYSRLEGIKQFSYSDSLIYEIILPHSATSVSISECPELRKIYAEGVEKINVINSPSLQSIEWGNHISEILLINTGFYQIEIPSGVKLPRRAFFGCKNLRMISIGERVYLPENTFENCVNLESVNLPNDLTVLEPNLFLNCRNLRFVRGGHSVHQVFRSAFTGCERLELIENNLFYQFTNIHITDRDWCNNINKSTNLVEQEDLEAIEDFIMSLELQDIYNPAEYLLSHFFDSTEHIIGILIDFDNRLNRWIIWSLNKFRFFFTVQDNVNSKKYAKWDIVSFDYVKIHSIIVREHIIINRQLDCIDYNRISLVKGTEAAGKFDKLYQYIDNRKFNKGIIYQEYKKISRKINKLDIKSIIDSYTINEKTWWQSYPGRDDSEYYKRVAKSKYTDSYIRMLLPQEDSLGYTNGCRPWGADEQKRMETKELQKEADVEATKKRIMARRKYNKIEHICNLLETALEERRKLEQEIENTYHIHAAELYLDSKASEYRIQREEWYMLSLSNSTLEQILARQS